MLRADEPACKPDPVPGLAAGGRSSIWACRCRQALAAYPQARAGSPRTPAQEPAAPSWPCSGWGLPSHPGHPGCWWSLTPPFHPYLTLVTPGGLFSVALSRGSPRVAVNNHPALRSPDFPRRAEPAATALPTRPRHQGNAGRVMSIITTRQAVPAWQHAVHAPLLLGVLVFAVVRPRGLPEALVAVPAAAPGAGRSASPTRRRPGGGCSSWCRRWCSSPRCWCSPTWPATRACSPGSAASSRGPARAHRAGCSASRSAPPP